ncbi:glycoside hydrolase family 15 protein [Mucilaginibacter sp. CSA2-8R]|uniref:glycoside hydrolase family 15 protein n=1 Tax=Mucilaginibacter sp. CSA2-8R TaxID=3141542 RepID=UPI00315D98DE
MKQPDISSLGVISDRQTCALLDKDATLSWYCPEAFDHPAIFSSLIDEDQGGFWDLQFDCKRFVSRGFSGRSSVLHTHFDVNGTPFTVTDFMPIGTQLNGICRKTDTAPAVITAKVRVRANYGLNAIQLLQRDGYCIELIGTNQWLHCSHALQVDNDIISYTVPDGEKGWAALIDSEQFNEGGMDDALQTTLMAWQEIEKHIDYKGLFEKEVCNSLRALQQLVYEPTGGIIAAPTLGLPEVIGGKRNYDYRYVWMRDAALVTSSLVGLKTDGKVEQNFLSFIAGAMQKNKQTHASCFYGINQSVRTEAQDLPLKGYCNSQPLLVGNNAASQFQLDAESSILLACGAIYSKLNNKEEWDIVETLADYICKNWERKDNGIWEEEQVQHYTSSKALAARALEVMAPYQPNAERAERWLYNAGLIRNFIAQNCLTTDGAYAVYAGSEDVDIACALFVPFGFVEASNPTMVKTIAAIEQRYAEGHLYRRHLLEFDSSQEGVFLAASCWMAHYYALAGNLSKSEAILHAMQGCANDLGYFSEEMDLRSYKMLGNFPQTFVHSSFICAVNGLQQAMHNKAS